VSKAESLKRPLIPITHVIPYYRNAPMIRVHVDNWQRYEKQVIDNLRIILVDDFSPEEERPEEILRTLPANILRRVTLLRITTDIDWNQHGARNLGAQVAGRGWLLVTDIDRVCLSADMLAMMRYKLKSNRFYKPVGVRMHSVLLEQDRPKGPYNQLLIHHSTYWKVGGYDEDYCGCYGGDKEFLDAVAGVAKFERIHSARMYRYSHYNVKGANTHDLDRDTAEWLRRRERKLASGDTVPHDPIRFKWKEISL
jgi:hypothetical protein